MVVAIDGPAGTGKSTVSTRVADATGFFYINSGRFYRAITWKALRNDGNLLNRDALVSTASEISIDISGDRFLVDGVPRGDELHTPAVDAEVAAVSSIPEIREAVNERIKEIAGTRDIIVEGRDMSTVVFPDADVKIYLDAAPEIRARRRLAQLGETEGDYESTLDAIRRRDEIDRSKATGRLERSSDAVYLDTTDLTLDQVCERVIVIIHVKTKHGRS